ncbi:MAG: hypothetical protein Q8K89_08850 [Actinomycetota bacterium]|nr:hypothetical protein [Actinomycetota bacterium]
MSTLVQSTIAALEPFVGHMVADTCMRATALSLGKSSDELTASDLPTLENNIRRLLAPVAPRAAIDAILSDIRSAA